MKILLKQQHTNCSGRWDNSAFVQCYFTYLRNSAAFTTSAFTVRRMRKWPSDLLTPIRVTHRLCRPGSGQGGVGDPVLLDLARGRLPAHVEAVGGGVVHLDVPGRCAWDCEGHREKKKRCGLRFIYKSKPKWEQRTKWEQNVQQIVRRSV